MACRSAWAQLFIFASIAVTLPGRKPRRSARRPRIGTSIRTVNPARSSQAQMGSASSDSRRNDTRALYLLPREKLLVNPARDSNGPRVPGCPRGIERSPREGLRSRDERQLPPDGVLPDLIPLPDKDEL